MAADPHQLDLFPGGSPVGEAEDLAPGGGCEAAPAGESSRAMPSASPEAAAGDLFPRLDRLLGGRLAELVLTCNRRRILSVRPAPRGPGSFAVRLDAGFEGAPEEVLRAVAQWIATEGPRRRRALAVIRRHFESSRRDGAETPARSRREPRLQPLGCRLDLRQVFDELNRAFFDGRLEAGLTWGRTPSRRRRGRRRGGRKTLRLGSYCWERNVIRIHRALDHPSVPRYVVASVVYHEMLHAALPPPASGGGRRRIHPPEFHRLEARFPDHERARRWVERHFDALLRRR